MEMNIVKHDNLKGDFVAFLIDEDLKPSESLSRSSFSKNLNAGLAAYPHFKGKKGQIISMPSGVEEFKTMLLVGLGKKSELSDEVLESVGGKLCNFMNSLEAKSVKIVIDSFPGKKITDSDAVYHIGLGLGLKNYRYNEFFSDKLDDHKVSLKSVDFAVRDLEASKKKLKDAQNLCDAIYTTKNLVSTPPNVLYPATFVAECKKLSKLGIKVNVFKESDMQKLGMNALLGVGQGSEKESYMVVMEYFGAKSKKEKPIAFVGKGVTFDTGGISIKPAANMGDMKYDMAGAGTVTGLMKLLASRKAKVNAIGAIGLVENMPSGSAQRPGDVVKSMSGQTIEIDNTDAEGRLVLADVLWYTQKKYDPQFMINLATLTGAMVIALGENYAAGMFSNDDKLAEQLSKAGELTRDRVWRFPLADHFDKMINSDVADVRNTGNGRGAGSITAAQFLKRFVNEKTWAHLDIAGVAWDKQGSDTCAKGATGFGVRLLDELTRKYYEEK